VARMLARRWPIPKRRQITEELENARMMLEEEARKGRRPETSHRETASRRATASSRSRRPHSATMEPPGLRNPRLTTCLRGCGTRQLRPMDDVKLPPRRHLEELRTRLIRSLSRSAVSFRRLLQFVEPLGGDGLADRAGEAFDTVKVQIIVNGSSPSVLHQQLTVAVLLRGGGPPQTSLRVPRDPLPDLAVRAPASNPTT